MKLTERTIAALTLPPGKADAIFFDDAVPRFGIRIREAGSRQYVVCYRVGTQQRRVTLGSTAILKVEQARDKARDLLARVRDGRDPQVERPKPRRGPATPSRSRSGATSPSRRSACGRGPMPRRNDIS